MNVNDKLKDSYISHILPAACAQFGREERGEAQENFGSAATCDVNVIQALSRRIHFGKFVAESKFRKETGRFVEMIKRGDREGLGDAITDKKVEAKVLERLGLKAKTYGTDPSIEADGQGKINVEAVVAMYKVCESAWIRSVGVRSSCSCVLTDDRTGLSLSRRRSRLSISCRGSRARSGSEPREMNTQESECSSGSAPGNRHSHETMWKAAAAIHIMTGMTRKDFRTRHRLSVDTSKSFRKFVLSAALTRAPAAHEGSRGRSCMNAEQAHGMGADMESIDGKKR